MELKVCTMKRLLLSLLLLHFGLMNAQEAPVTMLRLRMPNTMIDSTWHNLLSALRQYPDCCDEVWFSTGVTAVQMDVHRDHVEKLKRAKEALRKIGIGTSVQVQMTIGHGDSPATLPMLPSRRSSTLALQVFPSCRASARMLPRCRRRN